MTLSFATILPPERVTVHQDIQSKKRALETLAGMFVGAEEEIFPFLDALNAREHLGSTGLGHGVALPHARLALLDEQQPAQARGAFIRLDQGVGYDAPDQQPVDLLFALVVPESFSDEHIQWLSLLAEMFSQPDFCGKLRNPELDAADLYTLITSWQSKLPPVPAAQ